MLSDVMHLSNRVVFSITGDDRKRFLHGLCSINIKDLPSKTTRYGLFLTSQGKFISDFFIYSYTDDEFLLDLHQDTVDEVVSVFKKYRLRSDVEWNIRDDLSVYFAVSADKDADPRIQDFGFRYIDSKSPDNQNGQMDLYNKRRIMYCLPEAVTDLIPNKSFAHHFMMDHLHAIDYDKGCYLGQEVVARAKFRGRISKVLFLIEGHDILHPDQEVMYKDTSVGKVFSTYEQYGISLLNMRFLGDDFNFDDCSSEIKCGDVVLKNITKPGWSYD